MTGYELAKTHRHTALSLVAIACMMKLLPRSVIRRPSLIALLSTLVSLPVAAGGGYFSLGYGHLGKQTAGAVTAVAGDVYAGASNPAKLTAAGNQLEVGVEFLNPNRKVQRTGAEGAASIYNFSSTSSNPLYIVPEFAYSRQLDSTLASILR